MAHSAWLAGEPAVRPKEECVRCYVRLLCACLHSEPSQPWPSHLSACRLPIPASGNRSGSAWEQLSCSSSVWSSTWIRYKDRTTHCSKLAGHDSFLGLQAPTAADRVVQ